jgi:hypothetical protein
MNSFTLLGRRWRGSQASGASPPQSPALPGVSGGR